MDDDQIPRSPLEQHLFLLLQRRRNESRLRNLKASPPGSVDFSSNDFLSLSTSSGLRQSFLSELQARFSQLGSTGSRLLDGNSEFAESLERELAAFHEGQAGLLANSGFDANVSLFSCLPQARDVIVYDELIHASVHDGMRQSRAGELISFAHNCVDDLRMKLETCKQQRAGRNVFIAVESVYSMEGDLAPLAEMTDLIEELFPQQNAYLIVDEAHATGIYGAQGRGRVCELGLEGRVFARLHTFGKALACNGAVIICSPLTRLYLINYARPLIYTTFMSHPSLLAIKLAYRMMQLGETEPLAKHLNFLIGYLYKRLEGLKEATLEPLGVSSDILSVPEQCPHSPIFALMTQRPRELAKHCQDRGFVVRAVVPPTVPIGTERVRVCLHAGNTVREIDALVGCVRRWVRDQVYGEDDPEIKDLSKMVRVEPASVSQPGMQVARGLPPKL